jgi:6-phosphogluconolactonase (cycloisomerase 2 family)
VHAVAADGGIGAPIPQGRIDTGIYAHQIRTTPSGRSAILVTRGNDAGDGKPEDPGALKVYAFNDGQLTDRASIAPGGGYGFGPRHLDFHPTQPWVLVSIERQSQIQLFRMSQDERLEAMPAFSEDTLCEPQRKRIRQLAGPIRVHPDGRFAYISNRTDSRLDAGGRRMAAGGEDSIAVFAIDPTGGQLTRIQHVETPGKHVRNMAIEPGGRILVATNILPVLDRDADGRLVSFPACIAVYRIGLDGRLTLAHTLEVETGTAMQFWSGIAVLPAR